MTQKPLFQIVLAVVISAIVAVLVVFVLGGARIAFGGNYTGLNGLHLYEDLIVDKGATITGGLTVTGGLTQDTISTSGTTTINGLNFTVTNTTATDATLTPFAIHNPTGATSTVVLSIYDGKTSTSSYVLQIGTSTTPFVRSACISTCLIAATSSTYATSDLIATGTEAYLVTGDTGGTGGLFLTSTFPQRVVVKPNEWVVGTVNTPNNATNDAITSAVNTYTATLKLQWMK